MPWQVVALVSGVGLGVAAPVQGQTAKSSASPPSTQQQINELKRLIEQQQRVIQELEKRVEDLRGQTAETRQAVTTTQEQLDETRKATAEKPLITSGQPKVKLAISGHVNRAINFADDGDSAKAYFVDNENSVSRVRFVGSAQVTNDVSIGTRIELGIVPNSSNRVSQDNEDAGDKFDERIVEASLASKRLGTVHLGKGATSADGTSQVDLSGTDVLDYASVADIAGGLKFRDDDGNLSNITVSNAFTDYDGSRRDRVRYDSPTFAGFSLSGTAASHTRYDAALRWGGQTDDVKIASALAIQDPNNDNVNAIYNGSFSALHEPTGLNLTGSAGIQSQDEGDDPYNLYVKGGWIHPFLEIGPTAMSIDYTYSKNRPAEDDEGMSVGTALVQNLSEYGAELYAGVRWYTLDTDDGPDLHDIWVGTFGTRVKF